MRPFAETLASRPSFQCDDCEHYFEVVRTRTVTLIWVRPVDDPVDEEKDEDECSAPAATNQPT